jgi:hypothetical protein
LQKQLKGVVSENFDFRSTRVITRSMADFHFVKPLFDSQNLPYYSFFTKSEKPIKAVIRHLPQNTPAEDISDGLVSLDLDVVSAKQITATRRSPPEESKIINLPLFLVTLPRTAGQSQEIFRLSSLCHTAIRVEVYRAQNDLTQCHNCQQFGHVRANYKQPPRCLWFGGGHLHKECTEKGNTSSVPTCCNCQLAEGEEPQPANFRDCRHAKEEMQKKVAENTQDYNGEGVRFQPHHPRRVLRGGAPRQDMRTTAASDTSDGRSRHNGTQGPCGFTPTRTTKSRSVSSGHKYKEFFSGQNVESSSNGSTVDNDRI